MQYKLSHCKETNSHESIRFLGQSYFFHDILTLNVHNTLAFYWKFSSMQIANAQS